MRLPTVAAVMLCHGRDEMARRAIRSFTLQNCENKKHLLLWNNDGSRSIGALRNEANREVEADIIVHWDSDDWSHPNRIAEQVALLQSSGAECVGYNEMLFWSEITIETTRHPDSCPCGTCGPGKRDVISGPYNPKAWLYRAAVPNYAVGTSMCYWRETWKRNPFPDRSEGCDDLDWFNRDVKIFSGSAVPELIWGRNCVPVMPEDIGAEPRMIASIHGGNTCSKIDASKREWTRVASWDTFCREAMRIA